MMQKLASSLKLDMMFDLDTDQFELSNLLGKNGMTATDPTIVQAEHMRCLLLDWMTRLDGSVGYYSDPAANYGEGNGDISEIRDRQSWKAIGFWTSASDIGILEMGNVAWNGGDAAYVRHEWLYIGTRQAQQSIRVSSMAITGQHAGLFAIDTTAPIDFGNKDCVAVRITFSSSSTLASTPIDATLSIQWSEVDVTTGTAATAATTTSIQLTMKDYDFESQNLGYPPPPTIAPTISPAPTNPPTVRPTTSPPIAPSLGATTANPTVGESATTSAPTVAIGTGAATTMAPSMATAPTASSDNVTYTLPPAVLVDPDANSNSSSAVTSIGGSRMVLFAAAAITAVLFW